MKRRDCLRNMLLLGACAGTASHWGAQLAAGMRATGARRHLIVLWMPGGPSQLDTFDLKPGHTNGGPFKEIATTVPGIKISEHLASLAQHAEHLAIVRSMQTKEGDHSRGTFLVRTGQRPGAPLRYPSFPAALAKELSPGALRPDYVSMLPNSFVNPAAFGAGFLGAAREPLTVASMLPPNGNVVANNQLAEDPEAPIDLRVDNLLPASELAGDRLMRRKKIWEMLQESYGAASRPGAAATHDTVLRRAMQLTESDLVDAFDLTKEKDDVRRAYGNSAFGQGCLMARRLIEFGVPVIEVSLSEGLGGLAWDTHVDNFGAVRRLSQQLDRAWGRLMTELEERGLLELTTIAWMGEFGRTPTINPQGGRDHFPDAWSCVLAGAGIRGGSVVGKTSDDGKEVVDRPVNVPDLLATICQAVGVAPTVENTSDDRRPVKLSDGQPIKELCS